MKAPFERLRVWQAAQDLAVDVYQTTREFPADERYGLTSQLRRAAVSIAANIAEGNARGFRREYVQACYVARGSLAEVRSLLDLSVRIGYLSTGNYQRLTAGYGNVVGMLYRLIDSLRVHTHEP